MSEMSPEAMDKMVHRSCQLAVFGATAGAMLLMAPPSSWVRVGVFLAFAVGLCGVLLACAHEWENCPWCDGPPRRESTRKVRDARAVIVHSWLFRWVGRALALALAGLLLMPKGFLGDLSWWGREIEAAVLLVLFGAFAWIMLTSKTHTRYREECHVERCRVDRWRPPKRREALIAHYAPWILGVLLAAMCTTGLVALHHEAIRYAYVSVQLLAVYVVFVMGRFHWEMPCLICADRLPDNGGELAERRMWALKAAHRWRSSLVTYASCAWAASWPSGGHLVGRVLLTLAGLAVLVCLVLTRMHGRVQPWCPWCRGDDGHGAGADAPGPVDRKPVPA